jgi:hypothetical protein
MVNELRSLLNESSENAPYAAFDAAAVLRAGRSRTRRRRAAVVGAAGLAAAAVVVGSTLALGQLEPERAAPATTSTAPVGPVLHLADATPARLEPIFTHVNEDLEQANGQYVDGITTDGFAVFRDGPHGPQNQARMALVDLDSGDKAWLPDLPFHVNWLLEATADRLVYFGGTTGASAVVFDRTTSTWHEVSWPSLPARDWNARALGPDGRLYLALANPRPDVASPQELPIDESGEVDDAGAVGETGDLWSVSLTDPDDVRDEALEVGNFAFDESHLVWTDRGNGKADRVFVRDLASGEETSFDPRSGSNCNQLGLSVDEGKIVMSQYCGTEGRVRDDRIQIMTLDGEPVVTIQDDGIDGSANNGGRVLVYSYLPDQAGHYAYDLASGDFVRLGTTDSMYGMGGPVTDGYLLWTEGYQGREGSVQKIARVP